LSEIRVTTISDTAGTGPVTLTGQSAAKTFIRFDGSGTIAIASSQNVSSIDDDGTGDYGVNYTNNMSNANYTTTTGATSAATLTVIRLDTLSASSAELRTFDASSTVNAGNVALNIHGDLA